MGVEVLGAAGKGSGLFGDDGDAQAGGQMLGCSGGADFGLTSKLAVGVREGGSPRF